MPPQKPGKGALPRLFELLASLVCGCVIPVSASSFAQSFGSCLSLSFFSNHMACRILVP